MTPRVALLRAVNVGGTGALPMAALKALGEACGFAHARTYIASGNLLFASDLEEREIKALLEARLHDHFGRTVEVFVRSAAELDAIVAANPFPDAHGSHHMVFFHDTAPPPDLIAQCRDRNGERLALTGRELHVDYGAGIRTTRLKIPGKTARTARNINTVRKLAQLLHQV
ncbi:MAG: DUF1697 domain-containing protein [Novosphingobium sp.]